MGLNNAQISKLTPDKVRQALTQRPAQFERPKAIHEPEVGEKPILTPDTGNVELGKSKSIGPKNAAPYMQADAETADTLGIGPDVRWLGNIRVPHTLSHFDIAERLHKQGKAKDLSHSELSRIVAAVRGDVGEWVRQEANAPVNSERNKRASKTANNHSPEHPGAIPAGRTAAGGATAAVRGAEGPQASARDELRRGRCRPATRA